MRLRHLFVSAVCALVVVQAVVGPPTQAQAAGTWTKPATASLVGDSLTSANPQMYRDALAANGVGPAALSGVGSRALRNGWQCWVSGSLRIYASPVNSTCKREGLEELKHWAAQGTLGGAVVIALGTNDAGLYSSAQQMTNFSEARNVVGGRPIYLVTVFSTSSTANQRMVTFNNNAKAWCAADRACAVIDWAATSQAQNRAIYTDSVHLTSIGTSQRASYIAQQVVALAVQVDTSPLPSTSTVGSPVAFTAMRAPARLADSRLPLGLVRLEAGIHQRLQVAGVGGVPVKATAVAANLTVTATVSAGVLTVFPCGSRPNVSALNWPDAYATLANNQIVTLDSAGGFCVVASSRTHLVVDATGFFDADSVGRYNPVMPFRAADSRTGTGGITRLSGGQTVKVVVTGRGGVAGDASAVAANVAVVNPVTAGHVTLFPCGEARPGTSSLNFAAGEVRANNALVGVGAGGAVCVHSTAATDVILDVSGWFGTSGRRFQAVAPLRVLDTRSNHLVLSGGQITAPVRAGGSVTVTVAGVRGFPVGAAAAALNVTVASPPAPGFVTVYPSGSAAPGVSTLNHAMATVGNGTQASFGGGKFTLLAAAGGHLVVDVAGVWV
jgi:hypothetical protein